MTEGSLPLCHTLTYSYTLNSLLRSLMRCTDHLFTKCTLIRILSASFRIPTGCLSCRSLLPSDKCSQQLKAFQHRGKCSDQCASHVDQHALPLRTVSGSHNQINGVFLSSVLRDLAALIIFLRFSDIRSARFFLMEFPYDLAALGLSDLIERLVHLYDQVIHIGEARLIFHRDTAETSPAFLIIASVNADPYTIYGVFFPSLLLHIIPLSIDLPR